MPNFNVVKKIEPHNSFNAKYVIDKFDLKSESLQEIFTGELNLPEKWNIGLITGESGTGKSTIAKHIFGDDIITEYNFSNRPIVDEMPKNKSVNEIIKIFNRVGFSSPPSWLKPYHVLSNGEKMRVELAYNLLSDKEIICFDEYTSVVDRDVARSMSLCVSKAIRAQNRKFIAVTCHSDIAEYLTPDWIFDTNQMQFFFIPNLLEIQNWNLQFSNHIIHDGTCLGNIII